MVTTVSSPSLARDQTLGFSSLEVASGYNTARYNKQQVKIILLVVVLVVVVLVVEHILYVVLQVKLVVPMILLGKG